MKKLVVGDIHGCYAELQDLLDRAGLAEGDQIVAIGDFVDRGPESPRVLDWVRQNGNVTSVMGNHERKHVRSLRREVRPALSQRITRRQIGEADYPDACAFMDALPRFLDLDEAVLVHGFFEPGLPLGRQRETVVVGTLSGEHYLQEKYDRPWYELYTGDKPLVVGHHDYSGSGRPLIVRDLVFGIDTGCCHGRRLTGLLIPEFRIISVPSRRDYWLQQRQEHSDLRDAGIRDRDCTWGRAEEWTRSARRQTNLPPAAQQRIANLEALLEEGDRALHELFDYIVHLNAQVLAELRDGAAFDQLSSKEQGSLYAATIGNTPLSPLLHRARKGQLKLQDVRTYFKKPSDLIEFVERNDLGTIKRVDLPPSCP